MYRLKAELNFNYLIEMARFFIILNTLFFAISLSAQALTLQSNTSQVNLANEVSLLEDPTGALTIYDVSSTEFVDQFKPWQRTGDVNLGFTKSAWWLKVTLSRSVTAPSDWLLEVPYAYNKYLDFYAPTQNAILTGHARPVESRPLYSRYFVFPVDVNEAGRVYYFRVASNYAVSVPLNIWQPSAYAKNQLITFLIESSYYGAMLALVLYNAFLWLSLRDARFGFYALFGLFLNLGMFAANGLGSIMVWQNWPDFDDISSGLFYCLAGVFFIAFERSLLGTKITTPKRDKLLLAVGGLYLGNAFLLVASIGHKTWISTAYQGLFLLALFTMVLTPTVAIAQKNRQKTGVGFFLLAWSFLALGSLLAILRAYNFVPTNMLTVYASQIGSSMEMLLLSFALASILKYERQQRIEAQDIALVTNQKIISLLKDEERRLDDTVKAKTAELNMAFIREKRTLGEYLRFASLVSHEFRNALGVISSQAEMLREEHPESVEITHRSDVIRSRVSKLTGMTNRWLAGDRLLSKENKPLAQWLEMPLWIENFLGKLPDIIDSHKISYVVDSDVSRVWADSDLLEIALTNLLDNACKYSPLGSAVTIHVLHKKGMTGFAVTDQGVGVSHTMQTEIFERYYRSEPEGEVKGLGLGLNFVKRIAEAHSGRVEVESDLDKGSTFTIWFPDAKRL